MQYLKNQKEKETNLSVKPVDDITLQRGPIPNDFYNSHVTVCS